MDYQVAENAIQAYLATKFGSDVDVYVLPDTVEDYNKTVKKPRVTVAYDRSEFSEPPAIFGFQNEKVIFRLIVQSKTRKGTAGIFAVAADVLKYVVGQKFLALGEMYADKFELGEYSPEDKEWMYTLFVAANTILVRDVPETEDPVVTQITVQSPYNTAEIT